MRMSESLKTDTDFERLSPLCSQDYLDHLEESIKAHGCLDPIDIWDGIILNGYKRYRICLKLKIEIPINEKVFSCKEDAITWLC
jgi:ParB-like chromosome segregation protein Spo0J